MTSIAELPTYTPEPYVALLLEIVQLVKVNDTLVLVVCTAPPYAPSGLLDEA